MGGHFGSRGLHGIHSLDGGVEVGGLQLACCSGTESQAFYVLGYGEVLLGWCSRLYLQADGEDSEVGELDVLTEKEQFLGADYGIGQDALDGSLGEWGVMARHVFRQLIETDGLLGNHTWIPLLVSLAFLVVVLINSYSNHTVRK